MESMIIIGNSGNRRTTGLQAARARLGLPPAFVLDYRDVLQGNASLSSLAQSSGLMFAESPLLRIDAPGEHFEVERELIALGAPDAANTQIDERWLRYNKSVVQPILVRMAKGLKEIKGKLYHPSQWFRGYCKLLSRLDREAAQLWNTPRWMNAPEDIAAMFDKRYTHQILSSAGLPVPRRLAAPEAIPDYDTLRDAMAKERTYRLFIKLATGSGACGVIAYQVNPVTGAESAVTTIGVENYLRRPPVFYNVKKLMNYKEHQVIRQIINWLLGHGAHVEQWIPKASYRDRTFDIRQLVVAGQACHSIARASRTPITNLHLDSDRMSLEEVGMSDNLQAAVRQCAEQTLSVFQRSTVAGIDVLLSSGSYRPYVLDVNPFGDLLYHSHYEGHDPYEWEMRMASRSTNI
ncbi:STM4014 family protein [Paenibacillus sp. UMB4589-SE434]|uniref:STM4014 family protein n=1 Tax=Paenibacillus sp. UMB4589-SE434 TaxID=3046314 RepID=UPI0025505A30|nr:STM4014 family protein [Paenibacillus sp. UMB4589-SE434]MDK8180081.1 STM4014 family protein [Paenibacillus sp. UMB4589-SE434]